MQSLLQSNRRQTPLGSECRLFQVLTCFSIAFVLALGLVIYAASVSKVRLGTDLYPRWVGARAFWQSASPYSAAVQVDAEQLIYGRAHRPNETQYPFHYPAYLAVILLPFTLLPVVWAGIVWSSAMLAVSITLVVVWSWHLDPRPFPALWGLILLSGILYFPALSSVISGQYGLFVLACGILSWWLIAHGHDRWAGVVLVFATIKPTIGLFLPVVLGLWALRWKRWQIVGGFVATLLVLMGITMLKVGWWVPDFLAQTLTYGQINRDIDLAWSPDEIMTLPGLIWLAAALILAAIGAARAWSDPKFPAIALMGALYVNLALSPHTTDYDLTLLLLPLFWLGKRWQRQQWGLSLWLVLVWLPWLAWLAMMAAGDSALTRWKALWQFYPSLLIGVTLLWLGRKWLTAIFRGRRSPEWLQSGD